MPPILEVYDNSGAPIGKVRVSWWAVLWLVLITVVEVILLIWCFKLKNYSGKSYEWNTQMRRWAAHYYYCDSSHRDDAKCAQWSDHIPPPPPPPQY